MTLIYVAASFLFFFGLMALYVRIKLYFARKSGKYPMRDQLEESDVLALVADGQTILAIRAYRELHRCKIIEAKKAVYSIKKR